MTVLRVLGELGKATGLTGEEVPDLFDEVSQVIVGALHFVLGGGGFVQSSLGFTLGLLCLALGFCHLNERQTCLQRTQNVDRYKSNMKVSNYGCEFV